MDARKVVLKVAVLVKKTTLCAHLCKCIDSESNSDYFVQDEIDDQELEDWVDVEYRHH